MVQVLVIDDQPLEGRMISFVLERECPYAKYMGQAYNAVEGIEMAQKSSPDIVFLDISMPGMDGIEAIAHLRLIRQDMHIVILTAHDGFEYIQRAIRAGANDYLLKPTRPQDIHEAVDRWSGGEGRIPDDFITTATKFMEAHMEESITLTDVAESMYLSPAHFSRLFCSRTNTTFRAFLNERRLIRARHLLENTDLSVADIAARVGYREANSFTRLFRNAAGMSPSQYRKEHKKK